MKTLNHIEIDTVKLEMALKEREVWTRVACAVASANDCKKISVAIDWANDITDAYVKRFGRANEN